jgi:hypothetical protein
MHRNGASPVRRGGVGVLGQPRPGLLPDKGGRRNTAERSGLQGRTMRKSLLIPNALMCPLWKAVCSETSLHRLGRGG